MNPAIRAQLREAKALLDHLLRQHETDVFDQMSPP